MMSKREPVVDLRKRGHQDLANKLAKAFDLDGPDTELDDHEVATVAEYVGELIPLDDYRKGDAA